MKYKRSSRLGHTGVSFQEGGTFKSFESFSFASDFKHKPLGKEREREREKKNEKQTLGKEEREMEGVEARFHMSWRRRRRRRRRFSV